MRVLWRKRSVFHQFFVSERTVCALSAQGTLQTPAREASLIFRQTLIPGVRAAEARHRIRCLAGNDDLRMTFSMCEDAGAPSDPSGEAWDALETAIEIQFERAVIVPCLSPFVTDGASTPSRADGSTASRPLCSRARRRFRACAP